MVGFGYLGAILVLLVSVTLNALVLAYHWPRTPAVRRALDRAQRRVTGRPDWNWLQLRHLLAVLLVLSASNIVWQVSTLHCGDDSLALLASGRAALAGQNPFLISYCGHTTLDAIPYGLAAVSLNALAAVSGSVAGVWIVWQLLALAVVPLVWAVGGSQRRYLSVLAATSVLYLPNITTNIGVDNAIVPVSVLLMIYALTVGADRRGLLTGIAAFLSTARFPALFPLLGASATSGPARLRQLALVMGVFLGAAIVGYALWGWDAIGIVYLGEFTRDSGPTLNLFAVFLQQGWFTPSLASAAIQGGVLLGLVIFVGLRRYSVRAACAIPLLGVMSLSQYLDFHFVLWVLPVILLGAAVNSWLLVYGTVAALDTIVGVGYFGETLGIWWPYEAFGVALSVVLLFLLILVIRGEERRIRSGPPGSPDAATEVDASRGSGESTAH